VEGRTANPGNVPLDHPGRPRIHHRGHLVSHLIRPGAAVARVSRPGAARRRGDGAVAAERDRESNPLLRYGHSESCVRVVGAVSDSSGDGGAAVRWWAASASVILFAVACSSGSGSGQPGHVSRSPAAPAGSQQAAAASASPGSAGNGGLSGASALAGQGELAYIAAGRLYLLGGSAGALHRVGLPGVPTAPSWSPDHRWLAVQVSAPAPASNPYQTGPAVLYVLRADGSGLRALTPTSWTTQQYAWAPGQDELAAVVVPAATGTSIPTSRLETINPVTGAVRVLLSAPAITGVAWSPDGKTLAAGASETSGQPGSNSFHWVGELETMPASGGTGTVVRSWADGLLELAGWWPDGSGLLYWPDPQGSASLAADGLPLDSIQLATGVSRTLVTGMLVHSSWIAFAPGGHELAVVSGGNREIWLGGKAITVCGQSVSCKPVAQPSGTVSTQPSWSPAGRLTFARGSASGPFGPNGKADFSTAWVTRWEATQQLWSAAGNGAGQARVPGTGAGALDPVWARNDALMFVRDNWLWLLPAGSKSAERVAGPLNDISNLDITNITYYGYVPYPKLIAWTAARPQATAGTS
jgi:Tol biopolymer transport system component